MQADRFKRLSVWRRTVILFGLLTATSNLVRAQHLPIKEYTTADGLAQNQINQIVRDSRGYLWFCTAEGLSRFDGYRFTSYTTEQGLPHRSVRDLLETRGGTYWVATGEGLCRFNLRAAEPLSREPLFVDFRPGENNLARSIQVLYEDSASRVWVGTDAGLYRLEGSDGQVEIHLVEIGLLREDADDPVVEDILQDRQGALWVSTRGSGLYRRFPDGRTQRYTLRHGLPSDRVNTLLEDREGQLWAGTNKGLCLLVPEPDPTRPVVARVYTRKDFGLASDWVEDLFQSSDGKIWIGLAGGLSEFTPAAGKDGQQFRSYVTAHGLSNLDLTSLADDSAGNLWIGATYGAMKLARDGFITYSEASDLAACDVASIFETRSGELCVLARDRSAKMRLNRFDGERFSRIEPNFPKHITHFGWGFNQYGFQDRTGQWWIPTGQGLCRFPDVRRVEQLAYTRPKAVYTTKDGLIADEAWRIFEDSRGDIWIGSAFMTRWERATETFYRYPEAAGLPSGDWAEAFCEDASGNVWIGIGGMLARYAAGRFTLFTTSDGLPGSPIHALHLDRVGGLWVATDRNGLNLIRHLGADRLEVVTYTTAEGLSSNQVWCIASDRWGRIYAFTGRGLDRLDPASGQIKHYTQADGLVRGVPKAAFSDRQGALWFGTDLGLSRLIPEPDSPPSPPPVMISGLRIAGQPRAISELGETAVEDIRLSPNENQIQIDFVGLSFVTGEKLRYQYRLEGTGEDWSALADYRSVNYANLSPGRYRFLVRAVSSDGKMSPLPATVSFTILPPVWQQWWFLTLTAMLAGFLIYAAYRYRLARLIELERVRTRIAADLHDDIGASLSRMAILSEVVKRQVAGGAQQSVPMLTDIADSARNLVGSMRDIVWATDPRRDNLISVVARIRQFASDVLESKGIEWSFHTPSEVEKIKLGPDQRRHIYLFFKEAINNVARHSHCRAVRLSLAVAHNQFVGEIGDDGRGFTVQPAGQVAADGDAGHGLENMRRRVAQLGGSLLIDSAPGRGAHLKLTIPLKQP